VLDDGLLDVCVIATPRTDAERDKLIPHVLDGSHVGLPGVYYAQGARVVLERLDGQPLGFEHDGDVWRPDGSSVTIEVRPGAVRVAAPLEPIAG
jgi:diacylglycerol kinase (ATP)